MEGLRWRNLVTVHLEYWKRISGGSTEGYVYWPLEDAKSAQNVKYSLLLAVSLQRQCKILVNFLCVTFDMTGFSSSLSMGMEVE